MINGVPGGAGATLGESQGLNSSFFADIEFFGGNHNPGGRARHGSRTPRARGAHGAHRGPHGASTGPPGAPRVPKGVQGAQL